MDGKPLPNLSSVALVEREEAPCAVEARDLRFSYGRKEVLRGISFTIGAGEVFAFLGPNASGKTTLFKILSTLLPAPQGSLTILGYDVARSSATLRRSLGVVFQNSAVDTKLSVVENLRYHGNLYGLWGVELRERIKVMLDLLGLSESADARVETLSGGYRRRVELAKALLHEPAILILDEPSSGLDPEARRDFFNYLLRLRASKSVTVVLTTHDMEEAERCDRVGVLHQGQLVAVGTAGDLKRSVGGDVVVIKAQRPEMLQMKLQQRFGLHVAIVDGRLRIEAPKGHLLVAEIVEAFGSEVESISFGRPTLEDVFTHLTGQRFSASSDDDWSL